MKEFVLVGIVSRESTLVLTCMACIPSQPNKVSPTWGEAYGLLSFEVTGVLVASLFSYVTSIDVGIVGNILLTILFSAVYVLFVEARVPGALSQASYRRALAVRATVLFSAFSVSASLFYEGFRLLDNDRIGSIIALIFVGMVLSFGSVFTGLYIGDRCVRRKREPKGGVA